MTTLDALHRRCSVNNPRLEITGALYFDAGMFFQVLEGPDDALSHLMSVILLDARHYQVRVLNRSVIETRTFADWSMKFVSGFTAGPGSGHFSYGDLVDADMAQLQTSTQMLLTA